ASTDEAEKTLYCSGDKCLICGLNRTRLADGPVAVATVQLAANPVSSKIPIQISAVVASTDLGSLIPSTGGAGSISVSAPPLSAGSSLNSISCQPSSLVSNTISSCTVTLSSATTSPVTINLSSDTPVVTVPPVVVIPLGQSTMSFSAVTATI